MRTERRGRAAPAGVDTVRPGVWGSAARWSVVSVAGVVLLAGCSSSSSNDEASFDKVNDLEVPDVQAASMIVPPAPPLPGLPAEPPAPADPSAPPPAVTGPGGSAPVPAPSPGGVTPPGVSDPGQLYPSPEDAGTRPGRGQPLTTHGVTNGFVAKLTGADSYSHTDQQWGVAGAGNAVMWDNGNGQVLTMFGDTFGSPRPSGEQSDQPPMVSGAGINVPILPKELGFPALPFVNLTQGGGQGSGYAGDTGTEGPTGFDWRSNTLAYSTTDDLRTGMAYDSFATDDPGHAAEMIGARKQPGVEVTTLPTSGLSIGDRQYVSYSSVQQWGPAPGSWTSNYSGLAYSDDNGHTWTKAPGAFWTNTGAAKDFQMPALAKRDGYIYMFGTENGRVGGVYVARVPEQSVLDKGAYEYWTSGGWSPDANAGPQPVTSGGVGEVSVRYSEDLGRWLMLATDVFNNGITLRQAVSPTGPWTEPKVVASAEDYPSIYGASIHPGSSGNDLYFTMSQWSSYNVYLMHATVGAQPVPGPSPQVPEIPLPGGARIPAGPAPDLGLPTLELPDSLRPPVDNPAAPNGPGD